MDTISAKIEDLIDVGWNGKDLAAYYRWTSRVEAFLRRALGDEIGNEFSKAAETDPYGWETHRSALTGMLEGIIAQRADLDQVSGVLAASSSARTVVPTSRRVFVVHGHDDGAKEAVARYLERVGLEAVILHEQANEGRTIIEKFEAHSDVAFAVVLLTPDDVGASKAEQGSLKPRARQNVVFELGYFAGKLTRGRVCALYKGGVELPSDLQGVLYIEIDAKGGWRMQLAQELMNVRLPIKLEGVLGS